MFDPWGEMPSLTPALFWEAGAPGPPVAGAPPSPLWGGFPHAGEGVGGWFVCSGTPHCVDRPVSNLLGVPVTGLINRVISRLTRDITGLTVSNQVAKREALS